VSRLDDMVRAGIAPGVKEHTARRPMGTTFLVDPVMGTQEADTLMCCHCQHHWQVEPGSGKQRGWCLRCDQPTCGKAACEEKCVPFEKALEDAERINRNLQVLRGR
jgi:hypothetical protein